MNEETVATDPGTAAPAAAESSTPAATTEPAEDRGDYEARLRSDPEFAVAEVKKFQAAKDRIEAESRGRAEKFRTLEPWVDQLGGANAVLGHLQRLGQLQGHPKMREMIEQFERTGSVPVTGATDSSSDADSPYLDPVERKLREVEGEMLRLREQLSRSESRQSQEGLKAHLSRLFSEHPYLTDDEKVRIASQVENQVRQWDQTEEGRKLIGQITYDSLKYVAAPVLLENLESIGERAYQRKMTQKRAASTEAVAPVQPNGREVSPKAQGSLDAIREFMRQNNLTELVPKASRR